MIFCKGEPVTRLSKASAVKAREKGLMEARSPQRKLVLDI